MLKLPLAGPSFLRVVFCFGLAVCQTSGYSQNAPTSSTAEQDLHAASLELVSVMGVKQKLLDSEDRTIAAGVDEMTRRNPDYNPAFEQE